MIFFRNVAVSDDHKPSSSFATTETNYYDLYFKFSSLSPSNVYSVLRKLDVKKSVSPDILSAKFLKEISAEITIPLTKLSNKSLETAAKVMEKIVAQQLSSYFENNHLLSPYQCAYREQLVAIDTIAQIKYVHMLHFWTFKRLLTHSIIISYFNV